jgi:hypothetical protein
LHFSLHVMGKNQAKSIKIPSPCLGDANVSAYQVDKLWCSGESQSTPE